MNNIKGNAPFILVDGEPWPYPNTQFSRSASQLVSEGRAATGELYITKIGKRRIEKFDGMNIPYLSYDDFLAVRRKIENMSVVITYWDDLLNRVNRRLYYFGDLTYTPFKFDTLNYSVCKPLSYIDIKCNMIDMGRDDL